MNTLHCAITDAALQRPLEVALLLTPVDFGGAEKVSWLYLSHADRTRVRLSPVLFVRPWEANNAFIGLLQEAGIAYRTIPVADRPDEQGGDPLRVPKSFRRLWAVLNSRPFDVVHTNGYLTDFFAAPLTTLLGLPHVATCHGFIWNNWKYKFYNFLDIQILKCADRVIAVSAELGQELRHRGVPAKRLAVIPNAVAPSSGEGFSNHTLPDPRGRLGCGPEARLLGYVGRLSPEKGGLHLLEALAQMVHRPQVRLVFIGHGPQQAELERRARDLQVADQVYFVGFQSPIDPWLCAMDLFILPSLTEGTPMAMLEAMAAGIPLVASAVGGVPAIVTHGRNGWLVPPADPGALAQAIDKLLDHPDMARDLAMQAQETVRTHYGVSPWCSTLETLYRQVLKKKGRARI